jgi:hypothetical protein
MLLNRSKTILQFRKELLNQLMPPRCQYGVAIALPLKQETRESYDRFVSNIRENIEKPEKEAESEYLARRIEPPSSLELGRTFLKNWNLKSWMPENGCQV